MELDTSMHKEDLLKGAYLGELNPANGENTGSKIETEYAVFARHIQSEEMIICTALHNTSKAALREFDQLLKDNALRYVDPSTKTLKRRHVVVNYQPWIEYTPETLDLPDNLGFGASIF